MNLPAIEVGHYEREGYFRADILIGNDGTEVVDNGIGEPWDRPKWRRRVGVSISPTGRSVRVWVDGDEITAPEPEEPG